MKLKKIAALALAGVMAVSMLAGCAGKTNTDTNTDTTVETTGAAVGVSSQIKLTNANVKLSDNATYTAWLSKAIEDAKLKTGDLVNVAAKCNEAAATSTVYAALNEQFKYNVENFDATYSNSKVSAFAAGTTTKNYMSVYTVVGEDFTQADVLTALSNKLDTVTANLKTTTEESGPKYYDHVYTGSVSLQKVTSADVTVWYALVTLTDTPTVRKS